MKKIEYPLLGECVYRTVLKNGLKVNLVPRPNFHKVYGIISTDFGSNDTHFCLPDTQEVRKVPAGSAHFLEHKLFEKKDHDAFELFGHFGADANAFTSYTKTSFLFSTTTNVKENLEILLDFVQSPYFTAKSVAKEKGIIAQEINMYADDADWRLYAGLVKNLYPGQPLSYDIAGTVDSVNQISVKDLYDLYQTFYHPSNMDLFMVGAIDVTETLEWINKNQAKKEFAPAIVPQRLDGRNEVAAKAVNPEQQLAFSVKRAKVAIGIRGFDRLPAGKAGLKYKLALQLLFYLLLGESSQDYQELYNQGIVDDSFDYSVVVERGFHFVWFSGDTDQPAIFRAKLTSLILHATSVLKTQTVEFQLAKKEFIGRQIRAMNVLEAIAEQYEGSLFDDATLFDKIPLLQELTLEDLLETAAKFISQPGMSVYALCPKEDD
ncbi:EF-P 5-aminopentanol modification-associated protein YfmH [Liquorilactobacillus satsumensis]|uniref:EF-P 5-aminopentanol modification-associated protein YfmH n=1 Tax=Liquorilactobacillus satsumensis TaxID=259059 RepID=UPI001E439D0C|nr:pitrilysin family protein [Liquorilactobacillus satsumensis]MCC7665707.1 peptidase M16 [Liquorilactobacillus satsumensis]MCP9356500.1 insulinase family protein [Liquorilactobacillus satsumensis]MCP9370361.1 insulinase family protein [Liquorilactobacillus satsumensis]